MIHKEISFERFVFTCTGCGHAWEADYDVQHVEDDHGHERDYFFRHQLHCSDPTGPGATTCPNCGRSSVMAHHDDPRTSPAAKCMGPEESVVKTNPTHATAPVLMFSGAR